MGDSLLLRVGNDGGGGFFKVCLFVIDKDDPISKVICQENSRNQVYIKFPSSLLYPVYKKTM